MRTLEQIKIPSREDERKESFKLMYLSAFPVIARYIKKAGGSLDDAKDIFQDAVIIFYERQANEDFVLTNSEEAYLLGISKHLWIKKYHLDKKNLSIEDHQYLNLIPDDYFPSPADHKILAFLERAGKKCLELLRSFYYEKLSMKEIAEIHGFSNQNSATSQKYKCIEKVRYSIKKNFTTYEDFLE